MITGTTQQPLRASPLAAISDRQRRPVLGAQAKATETDSAPVNVETARSLAGKTGQYDVRNMSPRNMAALSQALYQDGAISFQDHALLSFQPELSPEFNKMLAGTPDNADAPKDFIAQWTTQLQVHESLGQTSFAKNDQRMLNILGNLAALRESGANPN
ncbi:MAG: hypothetical protein WAZ34_10980 [Rhodocyclaceae bacterium]